MRETAAERIASRDEEFAVHTESLDKNSFAYQKAKLGKTIADGMDRLSAPLESDRFVFSTMTVSGACRGLFYGFAAAIVVAALCTSPLVAAFLGAGVMAASTIYFAVSDSQNHLENYMETDKFTPSQEVAQALGAVPNRAKEVAEDNKLLPSKARQEYVEANRQFLEENKSDVSFLMKEKQRRAEKAGNLVTSL